MMPILKPLTEETRYYLPRVDIGYYKCQHYEPVNLVIKVSLGNVPTDEDFDKLRMALKKWANDCGYGELAQELYIK